MCGGWGGESETQRERETETVTETKTERVHAIRQTNYVPHLASTTTVDIPLSLLLCVNYAPINSKSFTPLLSTPLHSNTKVVR